MEGTGRWTPAGIRVDRSWATVSRSSLYSRNIPLGGGTGLAGRDPQRSGGHRHWVKHTVRVRGVLEEGGLPDSAVGKRGAGGTLSLDLTCVSPCSTWWDHGGAVILSHPEKHWGARQLSNHPGTQLTVSTRHPMTPALRSPTTCQASSGLPTQTRQPCRAFPWLPLPREMTSAHPHIPCPTDWSLASKNNEVLFQMLTRKNIHAVFFNTIFYMYLATPGLNCSTQDL